jgi:hypothetical protein
MTSKMPGELAEADPGQFGLLATQGLERGLAPFGGGTQRRQDGGERGASRLVEQLRSLGVERDGSGADIERCRLGELDQRARALL